LLLGKIGLPSDIVRVQIRHLCGYLDTDGGVDARDLLRILLLNKDSYQATSAYLTLLRFQNDNTFFVTLENMQFYLLAWDDAAIADAMSAQLHDLTLGLATMSQAPKPIVMFSKR